ncbi:MAG: hypothetical protein C5B56_13065 [Proteobacteria bacterium]|nr:MAG: hypothetical protein C5B56_13065 [Pseudomonadota bacterium]
MEQSPLGEKSVLAIALSIRQFAICSTRSAEEKKPVREKKKACGSFRTPFFFVFFSFVLRRPSLHRPDSNCS